MQLFSVSSPNCESHSAINHMITALERRILCAIRMSLVITWDYTFLIVKQHDWLHYSICNFKQEALKGRYYTVSTYLMIVHSALVKSASNAWPCCAWSTCNLMQSLLDEPNPNSPANSQAAQLYQENRREYEKKVHAIVEQSWVYEESA